jgi:hypothetical protein
MKEIPCWIWKRTRDRVFLLHGTVVWYGMVHNTLLPTCIHNTHMNSNGKRYHGWWRRWRQHVHSMSLSVCCSLSLCLSVILLPSQDGLVGDDFRNNSHFLEDEICGLYTHCVKRMLLSFGSLGNFRYGHRYYVLLLPYSNLYGKW